jgi:hypothetical protein
LPERDVRAAKFIRFNKLCRRALHLASAKPLSVASRRKSAALLPVLAWMLSRYA